MVPKVAGSSPVDRPLLKDFFVTTLEAIFLGFIQGLTEFLPVSSSGHLKLSQYFLGFQDLHKYVVFDLICHLGTLCAIFLIYKQEIIDSFTTNRTRTLQVILGTLPLFPLVLIMKPIKALFNEPQYLGGFFLLTALILYAGIKLGHTKDQESIEKSKWRDPLAIGLFQALAILPGVSRSGATISAARILGWNAQEAVTFSFLLAIPAILGGTTIELAQLILKPQATTIPTLGLSQYVWGFVTSCSVGYFALSLLRQLANKQKFMYFVWYCLTLGGVTSLYFLMKSHG